MPANEFPIARKAYRGIIPSHRVTKFYGNNTELSDIKTMPDGYSPDSLNWITGSQMDMISLRRGTNLLGQTRGAAPGAITGLGVGTRYDGVQVPFFSYGRSVRYYDLATDDTYEIGTNMLPAAADGDDVSIFPYQNLAGAFVYLSSINSSVYKIVVANPGTAIDQVMADYKGILKFGQSRSLLFNRKGSNSFIDKTGLYMSWIDAVNAATAPPFAHVTAEATVSTGVAHYAYTLAAVTGKKTAFMLVITATVAAGSEVFQDDKNGNLLSNFGGTGTINYATGAVDVTFSDVTTGNLNNDYYTEDATSHGVLDFTFAGTRVAGTGRYFSQFDGGGPLNAVYPLANVFYGFHSLKTWQTSIPTDDNDQSSGVSVASNLPFRDKMGVGNPYAAFGGVDGIYFLNNANPFRPEVYVLKLYTGATAANIAAPTLISKALNLSGFVFDKAVIFEWGIYVALCFQQVVNGATDTFNTRMFLYNKKTGVWDLLDYPCSRLAEYGGTLISGDPGSNNVFTLFSGFDDDGSTIPNYWTSGMTNHGYPGQKRTNRMVVDGLIQTSQNIDVSISYDGGNFVKVAKIKGTGSYVDTGKSVAVGSYVEGSKVVGGGDTVYANPFQYEFIIASPRYEYIRVKFEASVPADDNDPESPGGGGYVQINFFEYKDIRWKSSRSMPVRNTP